MKEWTVEYTARSGTFLRGQATLADGKVTVTWNGISRTDELLGDPEVQARETLAELYVIALRQAPPSSGTKQ